MKRICRIVSVQQLIPIIIYLLVSVVSGFADDALTQGKNFLLKNQPDKALPLFYQASSEEQNNPKINLYLGICYISLGKYAEAEQQLLAGKSKDTSGSYLYSYNLGNVYFLQSRFTEEGNYTCIRTPSLPFAKETPIQTREKAFELVSSRPISPTHVT